LQIELFGSLPCCCCPGRPTLNLAFQNLVLLNCRGDQKKFFITKRKKEKP
jgi:hypothetical protein